MEGVIRLSLIGGVGNAVPFRTKNSKTPQRPSRAGGVRYTPITVRIRSERRLIGTYGRHIVNGDFMAAPQAIHYRGGIGTRLFSNKLVDGISDLVSYRGASLEATQVLAGLSQC
jgi:hypothetical protein